jgi:murein DD-endopeptidase MepM/ murein hydrolase activator NlpD
MMTLDAFQKFIAAQKGPRVEIITGLHKPDLAPGSLTDAEVTPGKPLRAGGYAEDRTIYTQPLFAPEGEEPRTIHLGLDIFAPAGADVFAPLSGRVHSSQINDNPGDYGPTIILEHTAGSEKFHTLYGHLSRDSLKGLKPGAAFMAGEPFAQLGTKRENGGWPPHLHFQVLLDIGKAKGDYPGVCKRSEAERWLALCPDPRPLLGLLA